MLVAALLMSSLAQADRAADPVRFDLRCMIATALLRDHPDSQVRAASVAASLFFFARVDAQIDEEELEARIEEEADELVNGDRSALVQACGAFMSVRGRALSAIGNRISARARAAGARPGTR